MEAVLGLLPSVEGRSPAASGCSVSLCDCGFAAKKQCNVGCGIGKSLKLFYKQQVNQLTVDMPSGVLLWCNKFTIIRTCSVLYLTSKWYLQPCVCGTNAPDVTSILGIPVVDTSNSKVNNGQTRPFAHSLCQFRVERWYSGASLCTVNVLS